MNAVTRIRGIRPSMDFRPGPATLTRGDLIELRLVPTHDLKRRTDASDIFYDEFRMTRAQQETCLKLTLKNIADELSHSPQPNMQFVNMWRASVQKLQRAMR